VLDSGGVVRRIVITADDFGWTDGHNLAIERAAAAGTLCRASLLANGAAFTQAVETAQRVPRLGVGVHLSLCEGRPLSGGREPGLAPLLRPDGGFYDGLGPLVRSYAAGRLDAAAVRAEWRRQIERALAAGLVLTHLDGHKHVHLLPPLVSLAVELAREYGVPYVRVPGEALSLQAALGRAAGWLVLSALARRARAAVRGAGLSTCDHFVGFVRSGAMTREHLLRAVRRARPGLTEIMVHPALRTPQFQAVLGDYAWAQSYRSEEEAAALCDPELRTALRT
jgi:predicted glycoside hydrolase/deacetylase ChbG (UPF0249 family)